MEDLVRRLRECRRLSQQQGLIRTKDWIEENGKQIKLFSVKELVRQYSLLLEENNKENNELIKIITR